MWRKRLHMELEIRGLMVTLTSGYESKVDAYRLQVTRRLFGTPASAEGNAVMPPEYVTDPDEAQQRFFELALRIAGRCRAGFRVQQEGLDHCRQIAALAAAITVRECVESR